MITLTISEYDSRDKLIRQDVETYPEFSEAKNEFQALLDTYQNDKDYADSHIPTYLWRFDYQVADIAKTNGTNVRIKLDTTPYSL